jgi:Tol biopolymer transport system component
MKPERWSKIESIFHKALAADETRRGSVIEESCAGDEDLRREVESLLAHHSDSATFIEKPAFAEQVNTNRAPTAATAAAPRPDLKDVAVGHYRILEEIGFGGMGVVYKAEDTRLGRLVALKFLPEHMAADSAALERFRREARSASSLNHPSICTIYDIDVYEGREFIVMEYLDGQTLAVYIAGRRGVGTELVAKLGMPIAEALGAAHSKGVIHRDIKPGNIFVTQSGLVKVLDFGVAKLVQESDKTAVTTLTETNTITGTLPYMSPEQLRGENLDARSDIYALGVVLYEIATGQRPYSSSLHGTLVDEILNRPASAPSGINRKLSAKADDIILKCLAKDPEDRYQTAKEIAVDLRHLSAQATSGAVSAQASTVRARRKVWPRLAAAAAFLALAFGLIVSVSGSRGASTPLEARQITFTGDKKDGGMVTDGARLYFQSDGHPVEMSVTGGTMQPLRASVVGMRISDISPDASQLLMFKPDLNDESGRGSIWTIPLLGGSPRRLGNGLTRGASWSPDRRSLAYADVNSVFLSDANGANSREIWNANRPVEGWIRFSPDSKRIRVTVDGRNSSDPLRIFEMNVDGSNVHPLSLDWPSDAAQWDGQWTPDGRHFVFISYRDGFSSTYELVSPRWFEFWKKDSAVRLTPEQMDVVAMTPTRDSANLLVIGRVAQGSMQAYDSKGQRFIPFLDGLAASSFVISPDRQWMVYADYPRHLLWRSRVDGSERLPLTDIPAWMPEWSADSKWVAFCNFKAIYRVSIDGGVPEQLTSEGSELEVNPTWSPDGTSIDFSDVPTPGHFTGIKVLDLATKKVSVWPGTPGMYLPSWSPDGKYMVAIKTGPKRVVVYSRETKSWRTLKQTGADWGFWRWSGDSKSILMAKIAAEPGEQPGVYRLNIADAKWTLVALFNGLSVNSSPFENFLSITSDGRPAMMSDTSVVQIYSLRWNPQ